MLLGNGAHINYVHHSNSNAWYLGNTTTPLYISMHSDFKGDDKNYVDFFEYLLENKASIKFKAVRGN